MTIPATPIADHPSAATGPDRPVPPRIAVFGDVTFDLLATIPDTARDARDEKVLSSFFDSYLGGTGLNVAVAVQALGNDALFFSAVGDDFVGRWATSELGTIGLYHHEVIEQPGRTPVAIIVIRGHARELIVNVGPPMRMTPVSRIELLTGCDAIYVTQSVSSLTYLVAAGLGEKVVLGFEAWMARLPEFPELLGPCRLGITNEMGWRAWRDSHRGALPRVTVVETRGDQGSVIHPATGEDLPIPAYPVQAVDATGAGDTYAATLLGELVAGRSLSEATRLASVAAALSTRSLGARAQLPPLPEMRSLARAFYGQ